MSNIIKRAQWVALLFAFVISLAVLPVSAGSIIINNNIGNVILTTGLLQAINNGEVRDLTKGSKIHEGDVLKSGEFSQSQIRMNDGALISLRAETEFGFNEYRYNEADDSANSSILNLIKGGFRTISGLIGEKSKQNYEVRTVVATVGIRGTHYGLTLCQQGGCNTDVNKGFKDGLYGSVIDGKVSATNDTGEFTFSNDEFFLIESQVSKPQRLIAPPGIIFGQQKKKVRTKHSTLHTAKNEDNTDSSEITDSSEATVSNDQMGLQQSRKKRRKQQASVVGTFAEASAIQVGSADVNFEVTGDIDLVEVISNQNTPTSAPSGFGASVSLFRQGSGLEPPIVPSVSGIITSDGTASNQILLDTNALANGLPTVVSVSNIDMGQSDKAELASANVLEAQTITIAGTTIDVGWGRWSEGYRYTQNGVVEATLGQLHYVVATETTTLAQLGGLTGSATYASIDGTRATDLVGNIATTHANVSMMVDFGAGLISSFNVDTVVNSTNYSAAGSSTTFNDAMTNGISLSGTANCVNCSGKASLAFVGAGAENAGTVYSILDGMGSVANGVSIMEVQL